MIAGRRGIHGALVVLLLAIVCAEADATILFDTFEPYDDYDTRVGWKIGFPNEGWDQGDPFSFAGTQYYRFESVELAAALCQGSNAIDIWLMTDAAGQPGVIVESLSLVGAMKPFDGMLVPPPIAYSTSHPILAPDTTYWLVASAPDNDATSAAWYLNSADFFGGHAQRMAGESWDIVEDAFGAFRINGTPCDPPTCTPIPGAILLGALGVGAIGALRNRNVL